MLKFFLIDLSVLFFLVHGFSYFSIEGRETIKDGIFSNPFDFKKWNPVQSMDEEEQRNKDRQDPSAEEKTEAEGIFKLNSFSTELNSKTKEDVSNYVRKILKTDEYEKQKEKKEKNID